MDKFVRSSGAGPGRRPRALGASRGILAALLGAVLLAGTLGAAGVAKAGPIGYSVSSNGNDHLYSIDLMTGAATDLGLIGFGDAEGLSFAGNQLYTIGGTVGEFWNITTPPGFLVGSTGARTGIDAGLSYDATTGTMYHVNGESGSTILATVNLATGAVTGVGSTSSYADGLAINGAGAAFAINGLGTGELFSVDLGTGAMTLIGGLGVGTLGVQFGLSFAGDGTLWAINSGGDIYTINTTTGQATLSAQVHDVTGAPLTGFEGLAISSAGTIPEPATLTIFGIGLAGLGFARRRKTA